MTSYHPPSPRDNIRTPKAAIDKLVKASREHIYIFKNGKQVLRFEGDTDKVIIEDIHLFQMNDSIVIHNHPGGASFSVEDVIGLIRYNAKQCILVTEKYTYHLSRPGKEWNINIDSKDFLDQYEACKSIAENELEKMITKFEISRHEKEIEIIHYIWMFFFREMNSIQYVREKIAQF